ncbi:hypothetical protein Tco_0676302 [Tanacetum coccineum]
MNHNQDPTKPNLSHLVDENRKTMMRRAGSSDLLRRKKRKKGEESGEDEARRKPKKLHKLITEDEDEALQKRPVVDGTDAVMELLLAETYIQVSEDPKEGEALTRDTFLV